MAYTRQQEGGTVIPGLHQLLPSLHPGILGPGPALFDLTQNNSDWHWKEAERSAFEAIRKRVVSAPILMFPDDSRPFGWRRTAQICHRAVLSQAVSIGQHVASGCYYSKSPMPWNVTMRSTTKRCWQSSGPWRTGAIS